MDFEKFYDKQPDYVAFRNDSGKREDYTITVDWKVRKLVQLLPDSFKAGNILEIGCAFGILLNNIADRLHLQKRLGIDISGNNIEEAKKFFPECNFFHGTLEEFIRIIPDEILNHKYDLVVLSDIVEHIPDDRGFMKTVKEMSIYVLLNLPLEKSFNTRNRQYGEQDPSGHLRCYDERDAIKLVTDAGFEVVTSFTEIGFFDKSFYRMYTRNRKARVRLKPLPLRIFWSVFYLGEDMLKLMNRKFTEKIIGTNYFALLKSVN